MTRGVGIPGLALRPGMRVRLPSARVVELILLTGGRDGAPWWSCGYVEGGVLRRGKAGAKRLVLRHDWLVRYGVLQA